MPPAATVIVPEDGPRLTPAPMSRRAPVPTRMLPLFAKLPVPPTWPWPLTEIEEPDASVNPPPAAVPSTLLPSVTATFASVSWSRARSSVPGPVSRIVPAPAPPAPA